MASPDDYWLVASNPPVSHACINPQGTGQLCASTVKLRWQNGSSRTCTIAPGNQGGRKQIQGSGGSRGWSLYVASWTGRNLKQWPQQLLAPTKAFPVVRPALLVQVTLSNCTLYLPAFCILVPTGRPGINLFSSSHRNTLSASNLCFQTPISPYSGTLLIKIARLQQWTLNNYRRPSVTWHRRSAFPEPHPSGWLNVYNNHQRYSIVVSAGKEGTALVPCCKPSC